MTALRLILLSCFASACTSEPNIEPVDGACGAIETPETPAPVGAECFGNETECPDTRPTLGASCGAPRTCTIDDWAYECADGRWNDASEEFDSAPPLTEMCLDPFGGTLEDAQILLGPATSEPFRPFTDCEAHDLVWGPQGGAMIPFRLRILGDDPPDCIGVRTQLSVGEIQGEPADNRAALHCGQSMLVYAVVPWDLQRGLCGAPEEVVMKLAVEVPGIGTAFARVRVRTPSDCGGEEDG